MCHFQCCKSGPFFGQIRIWIFKSFGRAQSNLIFNKFSIHIKKLLSCWNYVIAYLHFYSSLKKITPVLQKNLVKTSFVWENCYNIYFNIKKVYEYQDRIRFRNRFIRTRQNRPGSATLVVSKQYSMPRVVRYERDELAALQGSGSGSELIFSPGSRRENFQI